jgi:hypothetical protein
LRALAQLLRVRGEGLDRGAQAVTGAVDGVRHRAELVAGANLGRHCQVALGHRLQRGRHGAELRPHQADHRGAHDAGDEDSGDQGDQDDRPGFPVRLRADRGHLVGLAVFGRLQGHHRGVDGVLDLVELGGGPIGGRHCVAARDGLAEDDRLA